MNGIEKDMIVLKSIIKEEYNMETEYTKKQKEKIAYTVEK